MNTNAFTNVQFTPTTNGTVIESWDQVVESWFDKATWTTAIITEAGVGVWGLSVRKGAAK